MTAAITDDGYDYLFEQLSVPPAGEFDEPVLASMLGLDIDGDAERKVQIYDLFFHQPVALNDLAFHSDVFKIFQDHSCHRPYREIQGKINELWTCGNTREEGIAADALYWALYDDAEWVIDEHVSDDTYE